MRKEARQRQMNESTLTISVEECAKALGISKVSAYAAVRRGDLPTLKIGRRILVSRKGLEAMLEAAGINFRGDAARGAS
jgi:excisionase family DNA binding protein